MVFLNFDAIVFHAAVLILAVSIVIAKTKSCYDYYSLNIHHPHRIDVRNCMCT
jgi:hypothetical protein